MEQFLVLLKENFTINLEYIFFAIFILAFLIEVIFYVCFYLKIALYRNNKKKIADIPISIVICSKDEEENLKNNLPLILAQKYKNLDIFVVLDACSDNSEAVLKELSTKHGNLRYSIIHKDDKFAHGKKLALTVGIKGAKNEHLLLTDADCMPSSIGWVSQMSANFSEQQQIVLGYGKYAPVKKSILNKIIRYDTFFIAQQYLGMALAKCPYMGVGRNLAYTKSIYKSQKGFSSHFHIESGDDDLLVNSAADNKNCAVEISVDAHTISEPPTSFKKWMQQKSRHLKASKKYKFKHRILLCMEPLARCVVWYAPILLLFYSKLQLYVIVVAIFRFIMFMTVIKLNMSKLCEKNFWLLAPFFDIFLPVFTVMSSMSNFRKKNKKIWK